MRLHGIKHYALLPIEGGALIMYFAPYSPYDYSEFPDCLKIDSYYITSNKVYFENLQLLQSLKAKGLDANRYRNKTLAASYEHLCKLRDEVISMGIIPPVEEWRSLNPHLK